MGTTTPAATHNLGRAHDGTEVAGVGDMVEHHHECGRAGRCGGDDVGEVGIGELANLEDDALVGAMARDRVELGAGHAPDAHARLAQGRRAQVADGRLVLHALRDQRALDGKAGSQRLKRGAAPLDVIALGGMDVTALRRCGLLGPRRLRHALLGHRPSPASLRALRAAFGPALRLSLIIAALLRALLLCHLGPFQSDSLADIVTSRYAKCTRLPHPSALITYTPHPGTPDAA